MFARPSLSRRAVFCALFLAAFCAFAAPKPKETAPRFNAKTTTGEKFTNETIKGKVVLLEFWTTWCVYCFQEAPFVDELNQECGDKGLVVLSIDVAESRKTVEKYLKQYPRKSRIVLTDDTNLAAMYAATVYPIYVVIDRDGNIAGTQRGAGGEAALRQLLASGGIGWKDSTGCAVAARWSLLCPHRGDSTCHFGQPAKSETNSSTNQPLCEGKPRACAAEIHAQWLRCDQPDSTPQESGM
jgi:thiol-disulfide isomerase/thioredoxin